VSAGRPKPPSEAAANSSHPAAPVGAVPRPPGWWATLRAEPPDWIGKLLGLGCIALVLLVWWLFTRGDTATSRPISPEKLPSPLEVYRAIDGLPEGSLTEGIIATLTRVLKGFGLAAIVGVTFGVAAASFRGLAAFFQPLVIFGRSVPISALLPVSFLFFGIDERQKMMFIFIATVPFVFSDTVKAVSLVPERYVETAHTLGATRWQIISKVLFPLALPDIVTGLRFLFGLGFGYIMLAETLNVKAGLGFLINTAERRSNGPQAYLMLILIALLAYAFDWLLRLFQRYFFHYRKDL